MVHFYVSYSNGFQTFRPMYFSPHGRFAQTLDDSPHRRFALWSIRPMVDSPPRRFAPWTIRPMVDSPTPRWLCIRDDSPPGRFAPLKFCIVYCDGKPVVHPSVTNVMCAKTAIATATILGSLARLNIIVFRKGMFCEERCGDLTNFTPILRNEESNPQIHSVLNA